MDPEPLEEIVTAYSGVPVFLRAARSLDVGGMVHRHVRLKKRERGLDEAGYVESFLVLKDKRISPAESKSPIPLESMSVCVLRKKDKNLGYG